MSDKGPSGLAVLKAEVEAIRAGKLAPVYVLSGDESYYADRLQDELIKWVQPDLKDFNLDIFYGNETPIRRVLNAARSFPMMADRRMVIVRESRFLFDRNLTQSDDLSSDTDLFLDYLRQPNPQSVLVLVDSTVPAGNTTLSKAMRSSPGIRFLEFKAVPEFELQDWIAHVAKWSYGLDIEPEAARLMAQRMGPHLDLLSNELDKLCTQNRTSKPIGLDEVRAKIPVTREFSVFELKEALLARDHDRTFHIAERLLHQGDSDVGEVVKSVSFFYTVFSNIWQYQRLTAKGLPSDQIKERMEVGKSFFYLQKEAAVYQPRNWSLVFEALHDADRAVKGRSRLEPSVIYMMMLKRIMTA